MADRARLWNDLCDRLGVKPKQFATLLAVMAVAVGGLGIKMTAGGPRKASAASVSRAKAPKAVPAQDSAASGKPAKASGGASKSASRKAGSESTVPLAARRVVEVTLAHQPSRDPFRPWGLPEPATSVASPVAVERPRPAPGYLPGLPLRAVVSGELAVFGDQTVRAGDSVALPDGTFARIVAVRDRVVSVEWNGRPLEVGLGAAPQQKAQTAGGFR